MTAHHIVIDSDIDDKPEQIQIHKTVQASLRLMRGDDALIVTRLSYETKSLKKDMA